MSDNPFRGPWARIPGGKQVYPDTPMTTHIGLSIAQAMVVAGDKIKVHWHNPDYDWHWFEVVDKLPNPYYGMSFTLKGICDQDDGTPHNGAIVKCSCNEFVIERINGREGNIREVVKPITGNNPESCQSSVVTEEDRDIQPASIVDDVIDDLKYRREVGKRKYGRELLSDVPCANGKSALENAYEEALDLAVYLKKALEEK